VFENRALTRIFGPKRDEVTGEWRKLHNEELNPLTPELNPSAQRCQMRFFTGDFTSSTVHFVNVNVKNQQM
jgi:hypothetical protein